MRGRSRRVPIQRALEGSGPARRAVPDAPVVCDVPPEMPASVADDPLAAAAWDQLIAVAPAGLLCALDVALLSVYAQSVALAQRAQDDIAANGLSGKRGGKNPSLSVLKSANDMVLRAVSMMGLAPVDRSRLNLQTQPAPSKFGDLLAQRAV